MQRKTKLSAIRGFVVVLGIPIFFVAAGCGKGEPQDFIECVQDSPEECNCFHTQNRTSQPPSVVCDTSKIVPAMDPRFPLHCCAFDGWPSSANGECDCGSGSELVGCSEVAYCSNSATGPTSSGATCTPEEPHTTYASCTKDSDCYSGYCKAPGTPGPNCQPPTDTVRDQGRGYDCTSDADCAAVAPDFVMRGGKATCYTASNTSKHSVCSFNCPP